MLFKHTSNSVDGIIYVLYTFPDGLEEIHAVLWNLLTHI